MLDQYFNMLLYKIDFIKNKWASGRMNCGGEKDWAIENAVKMSIMEGNKNHSFTFRMDSKRETINELGHDGISI